MQLIILELPLFLHMRSAAQDFIEIIKRNRSRFSLGVVHSFTGSYEEAMQIIELDLFIGINGCSLKTEDNLEVVKQLPLKSICIETDAPWCEIRPSHASSKYIKSHFVSKDKKKHDVNSMVKGRNEPCNIMFVTYIPPQH